MDLVMPATLSLIRCDSYEIERLTTALQRSLELIGGLAALIRPGQKVLIKPNCLGSFKPEQAITTHPTLVRAVAREVKRLGATPFIAENPGFMSLDATLKKTGIHKVMIEESLALGNLQDTFTLHNEQGQTFKHFELSQAFADADVIINLPKFKTHSLTLITGAVKNLFGSIPGLGKSKWHLRARNRAEFAGFLLDLYQAFQIGFTPAKPIIHIMDAIIGLEGEGPGASGKPHHIGAIVAGFDAIALDSLVCRIIGFDPKHMPTCRIGAERQLGCDQIEAMTLLGDSLADFAVENFVPPKSSQTSDLASWPTQHPIFKNLFVEKPVIRPEACIRCYQCVEICSSGALLRPSEPKGLPQFDYNTCIRCYCCQEICPEGAIILKAGPMGFLMNLYERLH
jgi:uncharacterized protein (DUF362 family)/NAD-dependent dihydropyrimidine dehydrogenase PreA subunit